MTADVVSIPLRDPHQRANRNGSATLLAPEFIAGEENALIRSVADRLLGSPRDPQTLAYNPWVLYGRSGVGKTHLAQGLLGRLQASGANVLCLTGADFARRYADAVETNSVQESREELFEYDYLLFDDVHQLRDKKAAQQELVILLDLLLDAQRQVLATLEKAPAETPRLLPGLASRLAAGLVTPLLPPGEAARQELARRFAAQLNIDVHESMIVALAESVIGTAGELRQTLLSSLMEAKSQSETFDQQFLERHLGDRRLAQKPTLRSITTKVCNRFQVKSTDLKSSTRRQAVVRARGVAMYLARQLTDKTLEEVGRHYGGRDHTTVLHACRKTETLLTEDPDLKKLVDEIKETLLT